MISIMCDLGANKKCENGGNCLSCFSPTNEEQVVVAQQKMTDFLKEHYHVENDTDGNLHCSKVSPRTMKVTLSAISKEILDEGLKKLRVTNSIGKNEHKKTLTSIGNIYTSIYIGLFVKSNSNLKNLLKEFSPIKFVDRTYMHNWVENFLKTIIKVSTPFYDNVGEIDNLNSGKAQ